MSRTSPPTIRFDTPLRAELEQCDLITALLGYQAWLIRVEEDLRTESDRITKMISADAYKRSHAKLLEYVAKAPAASGFALLRLGFQLLLRGRL